MSATATTGQPDAAPPDFHPFAALSAWFAENARELPWRGSRRDPWAVLTSEVMLQQTPVSRVIPVWRSWMQRWPQPASLARDTPGDAVVMWGRLGYPRRALRLHRAATVIALELDGRFPTREDELRRLPGVGSYTAAAVTAFALRRRTPVLDTNVRRVLARHRSGKAFPATASTTAAERELLDGLLPAADEEAAVLSEAVMELGALICTARAPRCRECPISRDCRWWATGAPANAVPPKRQAAFAGSDREVRGRILQLLRSTPRPVAQAEIDLTWPDDEQRTRAQASLLADGLLVGAGPGRYALPHT